MRKNLVLLGMMGAGKSTLGKIVAKKCGIKFIDTDLLIEKENSMSVKEIFEKKGEEFFRKEEEKIVFDSLKQENCVIALGGGAFINDKIRQKILSDTISIWLNVKIEELNRRIKKNLKRPLLKYNDNVETLKDIFDKRSGIYKLSNYKIDCDNNSLENITNKIINIYEKH